VARLFTTQTPGIPDVNEAINVTVGITLTFDVAGTVTGAWFYAPATVGSGTYEAAFWVLTHGDAGDLGTGTLLANQAFTSITAGAWNFVAFSSGVAVDSSHAYPITLRSSEGRYAATGAFFTSALVNGHITGVQNGSDPVGLGALYNGRFVDGSIAAFPNKTFNSNAYFVDVEFTASAGSSPPPGQQGRQHLFRPPHQPYRRARYTAPVRAQVNPPFPFTGVKQPRRLRGLTPRRGESFMPVRAQVVLAPPAFPPRLVRARPKGLRQARGHAAGPVPAQVVVAALAYPPRSVRGRRWGLRLSRPRVAGPVPVQVAVAPPSWAPAAVRARIKGMRLGRPHTTGPPVDQPVLPAAPHPRTRGVAPRRGHAATPPPPQVAPTPPAYPPQPVRTRLRGLRLLRGRGAAPVSPQVVVAPPARAPLPVHQRARMFPNRRGSSKTPYANTVSPLVPSAPGPILRTTTRVRTLLTSVRERLLHTDSQGD
jgi:hypothetical protein